MVASLNVEMLLAILLHGKSVENVVSACLRAKQPILLHT